MIIRSKAPLRIGLAGGGSDLSPFSDIYGGAILNATINSYAYATIEPTTDGKIRINAADRGESVEYTSQMVLPLDNQLDLLKGIYNRMAKEFSHKPLSFTLHTFVDAPPGSGLGSSSTLVVAIVGAFVEWLKLPLGEYDIAKLAFEIERIDLNMAGGKQDQYAATFGGVNFMEFHANDNVIVNPLRIKETILDELAHNLVLYYTETSRYSSTIIESQQKNVVDKNEQSILAMQNIKDQAIQMKETLLKGDLNRIGEILNYGWENKKMMAHNITNTKINQIYETAIQSGSTGGKVSGAGGGGFMFFYCPGNTKYHVSNQLIKLGGGIKSFEFSTSGMKSWTC